MESLLLIKALVFITLLAGILYLLVIFLKKYKLPRENYPINVIHYARIDNKNSVCLIKADSNKFLIAMSPQAIAIHPILSRDET
jgi:flagellar biogenesis protein FliO